MNIFAKGLREFAIDIAPAIASSGVHPALAGSLWQALFFAPTAMAPDVDPKSHYGAFGTLGETYHRSKNSEFRRAIDQPHSAKPESLGWDADSLVGVQGDL